MRKGVYGNPVSAGFNVVGFDYSFTWFVRLESQSHCTREINADFDAISIT